MHLNYQETIKAIPRFIISAIILIIMFKIFNIILPVDSKNRLIQVFNLAVSGIVCGGTYLAINFKYLKDLLPKKLLDKLKITK